MRSGTVGGRQLGWGVLSTGGASDLGPGVRAGVWMYVTNDNKASSITCGPFEVPLVVGRRQETSGVRAAAAVQRLRRVSCRFISARNRTTTASSSVVKRSHAAAVLWASGRK